MANMLSYQHGYHAGNLADIVKHFTQTLLIQHLLQKDKSIFYLETHAGRGMYDLSCAQSAKTGEFLNGISKLWKVRHQLPAIFEPYLNTIQKYNPTDNLRYYPGSPVIALEQFRAQDRLFCCELHPQEFQQLNSLSSQNKRVFISNTDGIKQIDAQLPPKERRGLIFIDPAYEVKAEYKLIPMAIKAGYEKFNTGVYCLWYPIVDKHYHQQLLNALETIPAADKLHIEFNWEPSLSIGMGGCGLWIINPPYTLAENMKKGLTCLKEILELNKASFLVES